MTEITEFLQKYPQLADQITEIIKKSPNIVIFGLNDSCITGHHYGGTCRASLNGLYKKTLNRAYPEDYISCNEPINVDIPIYFHLNGEYWNNEQRSVRCIWKTASSGYLLTGAHYFCDDCVCLKKAVVDTEKYCIKVGKKLVTYENCYIVVGKEQKILPITDLDNFRPSIDVENYYDIARAFNKTIHNIQIDMECIEECYQLFLDSYDQFTVINCMGGPVNIPNYLKPLFGSSPIWHIEGFSSGGEHGVNSKDLKIVLRFLNNLVMTTDLPTVADYIKYDMNISEWLHISSYLNIPLFCDLFSKMEYYLKQKGM